MGDSSDVEIIDVDDEEGIDNEDNEEKRLRDELVEIAEVVEPFLRRKKEILRRLEELEEENYQQADAHGRWSDIDDDTDSSDSLEKDWKQKNCQWKGQVDAALRENFGYDSFRPLQRWIHHVLNLT